MFLVQLSIVHWVTSNHIRSCNTHFARLKLTFIRIYHRHSVQLQPPETPAADSCKREKRKQLLQSPPPMTRPPPTRVWTNQLWLRYCPHSIAGIYALTILSDFLWFCHTFYESPKYSVLEKGNFKDTEKVTGFLNSK